MNIIHNYLKEIRKPMLERLFRNNCEIKRINESESPLFWELICIFILETLNEIIWRYNLNYIPSKEMKEDIKWFMERIKE